MKIIRDKGIIENASAPTTADVYRVGTIWVDTTNDVSYTLTDVTAGVSTWLKTAGIGSGSIDLEGDYLLNDQTTTNMMSKGTVYRFDGVDDLITVTASAEITDIFANGGFIQSEIYPLSDGESDVGVIAEKTAGAAGWLFNIITEATGFVALHFVMQAATTDGDWTTTVSVPIGEWSKVMVIYNESTPTVAPSFYLNGVLLTVTTAVAPVGATSTDAAIDMIFGNLNTGIATFDGEISEVMFGNFAPTAAEVKDLISGNIPFKWQYGSQTELITDGEFDNWTVNNPDNWTDAGAPTVTKDTSDPYSGVNCLQMVCASEQGIYSDAFTALETGKNVSTRLAVKRTVGTGNLDVFLRVGAGGAVSTFMPITVTSSWAVYNIDFETISAAFTTLWVRTQSGETGTFLIDTVSAVKQGAVALYDQTSISETVWYDKANGNDGAVTGAEVLNAPSVTPLSCLRTFRIRFDTDNSGTSIDIVSLGSEFNAPAITDADDLIDTGTSGSWGLGASATNVTLTLTEKIVGVVAITTVNQDMNGSTAPQWYILPTLQADGTLLLTLRGEGSSSNQSWLAAIDAGDRWDVHFAIITNVG